MAHDTEKLRELLTDNVIDEAVKHSRVGGFGSPDEATADRYELGARRALAYLLGERSTLISQAESPTLRDGLTMAEAHKMEGGSGLSSCPLQAEGESA